MIIGWLFYSLIFIWGLIWGSFANVVIYRLAHQILSAKPFTLGGRSRCPDCQKTLSWSELIPLVSFLKQKGRCRGCRQPISWRYPVVETSFGVLFLLSFFVLPWSSGGELLFYWFLDGIFVILFFTDLFYLLLPDKILLIGLGGALSYELLAKTTALFSSWSIFSGGHLLAAFSFFGFLYLIWFFSQGRWLGLGDAKLMGLVGLVFGSLGAIFVFYAAIIFGGIIGLGLYFFWKADGQTKLPLGSFICLMALVYLFTGFRLVDYFQLFFIFR